jgi:NADPH-dependent 2,4-dienoyl-CoA reductase/sulfur reductase-like enzyme
VCAILPAARAVRTNCGRDFPFDVLVVATGARSRRLPDTAPHGVHYLRTLDDARRLRDKLVPRAHFAVVGGGFVGAEVASTAVSLGLDVTIIEASAAPLGRVLGSETGLLLADRWRSHGVDVRLGTGVVRFGAKSLALADGSELQTDVVLVGVGMEPVTELLPRGAVPWLRTAGDVSGPGHWTAAAADGAAAARAILGLPIASMSVPYVWSDQFGLRLQIVGSPSPADTPMLEGTRDSFTVRYVGAGGELRAALLANRQAEVSAFRQSLAEGALPLAA